MPPANRTPKFSSNSKAVSRAADKSLRKISLREDEQDAASDSEVPIAEHAGPTDIHDPAVIKEAKKQASDKKS